MPGFCGLTMADEILNFFYRGTAITIDDSLWIRFLVSPSSRSGGGTETNYSGYARYEITRDGTLFGIASSGVGRLGNTIRLQLPIANSLGNGDLNSFDIVDTPSGVFTKIYNGGPIIPPKAIVIGKNPTFDTGKLIFTF